MLPGEWRDQGASFGDDGLLYLPEWRRGFSIYELRALFFESQRARALDAELRTAARDLARLAAQNEVLERQVYWYRRQLVLESRMGMALARITE